MKNSGQRCVINPLPSKIRNCIYSEQWGDTRPMQNPPGMWLTPVRWWGQPGGGSSMPCWRLLRGRGWAGVLVLWVVAKSFPSSKDLGWFVGKSCLYQWDCAGAGARNKFSLWKRLAESGSFFFFLRPNARGLITANVLAKVFLLLWGQCKAVGFVGSPVSWFLMKATSSFTLLCKDEPEISL